MDHRLHQLQQPVAPGRSVPKSSEPKPSSAFKDVLHDVQELKLSKHAEQRLDERGITISQAEWQAMTDKVSEARQKGVTDSLVLTDETALLVSTKNNTVITGMHKAEAASKIFTNINGTILINSEADL
ncbi:hypothetical protein GCM10028778_03460 [Barrientosiimonas marina]|uniref:TIGR02530 family flagellar biosynthesis protein n=1 Tax=Lentibacillus kimchii TaxID=1542911 RepID=A0ABW2UPV7_9BACI